jgi:integral membrane sensor domain MASE1
VNPQNTSTETKPDPRSTSRRSRGSFIVSQEASASALGEVPAKGTWATQSRRFSGLPLVGILAVIYFIAGKLGLMLASMHANASPVWPPAGIALAALLLLGYRAWPAIFIGAFLVNVTTAGNVATSFAIGTGNTLEALVGAWLVNRFAGGTNVFDRPQGVSKFALAAGISAIISPAFGVTSLGVAGFADWANYGAIWLTWWLGDVTGDLVFTPLILLWSVASKRRWTKKEAAEVGALFLLLVLLSGVVFGGWPAISTRNYPIVLICGPIVIWTAFRFRQRETATGIFILSAIAVWGTLHGFGPFVRGTENESLLALQWWTAVLSITAMALSAGMAERRRVAEELQQQKVVLESANRTKDRFLTMLSNDLPPRFIPVISALESVEAEPAQTEGDRFGEPKSDLKAEIAHILLIDVPCYSKLSNNEQIELMKELDQIVQSTECFRSAAAAGKLIRVAMRDLHLFNLYKDGLRNPYVPEKLKRRTWKQESDVVRPGSLPRWLRCMAVLALVLAALAMVIGSLTFLQQVSLRMTASPSSSLLRWSVWASVLVSFWLCVSLFYAVLACQQRWAKRKALNRRWVATTEP